MQNVLDQCCSSTSHRSSGCKSSKVPLESNRRLSYSKSQRLSMESKSNTPKTPSSSSHQSNTPIRYSSAKSAHSKSLPSNQNDTSPPHFSFLNMSLEDSPSGSSVQSTSSTYSSPYSPHTGNNSRGAVLAAGKRTSGGSRHSFGTPITPSPQYQDKIKNENERRTGTSTDDPDTSIQDKSMEYFKAPEIHFLLIDEVYIHLLIWQSDYDHYK